MGRRNASQPAPPEEPLEPVAQVSPPGQDGRGRPIPGQEDIFVTMGRSQGSMLRDMLTGSLLPEEYLPRTRISEREIARDMRLQVIEQVIEDGIVDMNRIRAWKYNARIGRDGKGREEAVAMIVAERKRQERPADRARNLDGRPAPTG